MSNEWYETSDCDKISCFREVSEGQVSNHIQLNCIIGAKLILFKVIHCYYSQILSLDTFNSPRPIALKILRASAPSLKHIKNLEGLDCQVR